MRTLLWTSCLLCLCVCNPSRTMADDGQFTNLVGTATRRQVVAVSLGESAYLGSAAGVQVNLPGIGTMLLVCHPPFPSRGVSIVARGPWVLSPEWRAGVMWGGQWQTFEWPPLETLFVDEPSRSLPEDWREPLVKSSGFISRRTGRLTADDPRIDLVVEAYYYKNRASLALAGSSQNKLRSLMNKRRLENATNSFGQGPRPASTVRRTTKGLGSWRTALLYSDGPVRESVLFATGGHWVVLFLGESPVLVQDVARAYLWQVTP